MLDDLYWGLFAQSGNVDAYLAYKRAARRVGEQDAPAFEGEGEDGMKR